MGQPYLIRNSCLTFFRTTFLSLTVAMTSLAHGHTNPDPNTITPQSQCRQSLQPNLKKLILQINSIYDEQLFNPRSLTQNHAMTESAAPVEINHLFQMTPAEFTNQKELEKALRALSLLLFPETQSLWPLSPKEEDLIIQAKRTVLEKGVLQLIKQFELNPKTNEMIDSRFKRMLRPLLRSAFISKTHSWLKNEMTNEMTLEEAEKLLLMGLDGLPSHSPLLKTLGRQEKITQLTRAVTLLTFTALGMLMYQDQEIDPYQNSSTLFGNELFEFSLILLQSEFHQNLNDQQRETLQRALSPENVNPALR